MKLLGYAPNLDPATEGACVDVTNCIPTQRGMAGAPTPSNVSEAIAEEVNSAVTVENLSGETTTYAGSLTKLYELQTTTWSDVSGKTYACPVDGRWSFAEFGNFVIACQKGDILQVSSGGNFADISGAPQATMCAVANGFVMIADTLDGTYGDQSDRWWCSGYYDHTDWTPAISTQCTTGRIVTSPGGFKALNTLGDGFVLYKKNAIFVGSYVGAPEVWQWNRVEGDVGTHSNTCVVNASNYQYFLGNDDFYRFDGSRVESIGEVIRDWFYSDLNIDYAYATISMYNQTTGNVWWFYVSGNNSTTTPDKAVVYNIYTGKWGKKDISVEAVAQYIEPGISYHELGTEYDTYNDLPTDISYDSGYWLAGIESVGVIQTDHKFYALNANSTTSSITLNNIGDIAQFSTIRRVWPRFITDPSSGTMNYLYDDIHGDSFTSHSTVTYTDGRFDVLNSSRWHQCKLNMVGEYELVEVRVDLEPNGVE